MEFQVLDSSRVDWDRLDGFEDRLVFQTREWIEFLAETHNARLIVAELRDGNDVLGYFSGLIARHMGIRILGSPSPGWKTTNLGFNLVSGIPRRMALQALETFAFQTLNCLHLEVSDRYCSMSEGATLGFRYDPIRRLEVDLTEPEAQLYANMTPDRRWSIRKGEKNGVRIEEAHDEAFAAEHWEHLKDMYGRKGLAVTLQGREEVRNLIRRMLPTGRLLLLRARDPDGNPIASGISVGMNKVAFSWTLASLRAGHHLRPNELLIWHLIRYWKRRGIERLDFGGGNESDYKRRYGVVKEFYFPWFRKSRLSSLEYLRRCAKDLFWLQYRVRNKLEYNRKIASANDG